MKIKCYIKKIWYDVGYVCEAILEDVVITLLTSILLALAIMTPIIWFYDCFGSILAEFFARWAIIYIVLAILEILIYAIYKYLSSVKEYCNKL